MPPVLIYSLRLKPARPAGDVRKQRRANSLALQERLHDSPPPLSTRCSKMAYPSLWPTFAAFLLLLFSCISGSAWSEVSFLNIQIDGRNIHFGVFGCTGVGQPTLGYNVSHVIGPISLEIDDYLGSSLLSDLEKPLIIHLSAAILVFVVWAIMFWRRDVGKKVNLLWVVKIISFIFAAAGTSFVWVWDLVLFTGLRNGFRNNGIAADLGNAHWITLGAVIGLLLEPIWSVLEPSLHESLQRRGNQTLVTNVGIDEVGAAPTDPEKPPGFSKNAATNLPAKAPAVRDIPHTAKPPERRSRNVLENPTPPSQPPNDTNPSTTPRLKPLDDSESSSLTSHEDEHTPVLRRQYSAYLPYRTSPTDPSPTLWRVARHRYSFYVPEKLLPAVPDQPATSQTTPLGVPENRTPIFPTP